VARIATIDIGTNSVLLLVAEPAPGAAGPRVLADLAEITRLGEGLGASGALAPAAVERTLAAVRAQVAAARAAGAERVVAVGTQALREARNAEAFLVPAEAALGSPVEIVSGEREAELARRAVMESFPQLGEATLMDIGGGSTEFVVVRGGRVAFVASTRLGSVRLTERFGDDRAGIEAAVADAVRAVPFAGELVGIAGTVTTLAAVARGVEPYDAERVHGVRLGMDEVTEVIGRLAALPLEERRRVPGLQPKRADVIVAGMLIALGAMRAAGAPTLLVSDRGVRWGRWYELAAP